MNEEPNVVYQEPRGILTSIRMLFGSVADVAVETSNAAGTGARSLNALARTGLVMSESQERIVTIRTAAKEQAELRKLKEMYPELAED